MIPFFKVVYIYISKYSEPWNSSDSMFKMKFLEYLQCWTYVASENENRLGCSDNIKLRGVCHWYQNSL